MQKGGHREGSGRKPMVYYLVKINGQQVIIKTDKNMEQLKKTLESLSSSAEETIQPLKVIDL